MKLPCFWIISGMPGINFPDRKKLTTKNKTRDLALITLMAWNRNPCVRMSSLDVEDLDFKNDAVKVTRKGGNEMFVYFGEEVEKHCWITLKYVRQSLR